MGKSNNRSTQWRENWQAGCVVFGPLPKRQLVYYTENSEIALITYLTGGFGVMEHAALIQFDNDKIIDFWCGNSRGRLKDKDLILKYLREKKDEHWGLNTNIIFL